MSVFKKGYWEENKQTTWDIVYNDYSGIQKRAIEFLNKELSRYLLRDSEQYVIYVMPVIKESENFKVQENAVILSLYKDSKYVKKFVKLEELSKDGFLFKVVDNPDNEKGSVVIITANEESSLYRGAVYFIDDYLTKTAPAYGAIRARYRTFNGKILLGTHSEIIKNKTRSVFAWGHAINNYREYLQNLARLGINQLILWNDYPPVNAKDLVDYAHSYGIEVIWGFAWGWDEKRCKNFKDVMNEDLLKEMKANILKDYEKNWKGLGDGIYFQSFTETHMDTLNGKKISKVVSDFVNDVASEFYKNEPNIKIQFGLHAISVRNYVEDISKVDKRIEIMWEDCGAFPFDYDPNVIESEEVYNETIEFVKKIINLREKDAPMGLVFKGHATLDWTKFIHQKGPYILGENSVETQMHDNNLRSSAWNVLSSAWIRHGERVRKIIEIATEMGNGNINVCMAGVYDGGIYLPEALITEMFKNPFENYDDMCQRVNSREPIKYK